MKERDHLPASGLTVEIMRQDYLDAGLDVPTSRIQSLRQYIRQYTDDADYKRDRAQSADVCKYIKLAPCYPRTKMIFRGLQGVRREYEDLQTGAYLFLESLDDSETFDGYTSERDYAEAYASGEGIEYGHGVLFCLSGGCSFDTSIAGISLHPDEKEVLLAPSGIMKILAVRESMMTSCDNEPVLEITLRWTQEVS